MDSQYYNKQSVSNNNHQEWAENIMLSIDNYANSIDGGYVCKTGFGDGIYS